MTDDVYPGPGSLCWRLLGQKRMLLVTGRALILEAALPAGGAALARHSTYRTRPWRRLQLTLESLQRLTYGDPDTRERECARVRRAHQHIHGTDERGRPYDGLDDESRTWIMLTLFDAMVSMERLSGRPLTPAQEARLYREWRPLIAAFGIRKEVIPRDLTEYQERYRGTVERTLEDNPEVRHLLGTLYASVSVPPALSRCPQPVWRAVRVLAAAVMGSVLRADLPSPYGERLGLAPRLTDRTVSWLLHHVVRWAMACLPVRDRYLPVARAAVRTGHLRVPAGRHRMPAVPRQRRREARAERVGRFFDEVLDQTGDGVITREDLEAMARGVCWETELGDAGEQRVYDAFAAWWRQLSASADADGDGRISRAEYVAAALSGMDAGPGYLRDGLLRALDALFAAADTDGGGSLTMAGYRTLFGPRPHPADLNHGFREIDADGDGLITRTEFHEALSRYFTARDTSDAGTRLFGGV